MYDPSYFVERDQYIARVSEFVETEFEGKLKEVFNEVVSFYSELVDLAREYETCLDERRKLKIAKKYEKMAGLLQKYLDVMRSTMDECDGLTKIEESCL